MDMFDRVSGLSRYIKPMMNSQFPVTSLMESKDFLKYIALRDFSFSLKDLEYFDRNGLVRPVIRLKRPKLNQSRPPYLKYQYSGTDIYSFQDYFKMGLIEFPIDGDFQEWSNYSTEVLDVCLYYHPYQILQVDHIISHFNYVIKGTELDSIQNPAEYIHHLTDRLRRSIMQVKKSEVTRWINRTGLLILLDDYYGRWFKDKIPLNIFDTSSRPDRHKKLLAWAKNFSPNHILILSNMKLEEIEQFYIELSLHARKMDPIYEWFILQKIIKKSRKFKLKKQALLAQNYYDYLYMISLFIYDVTGKDMPEPDEVLRNDSRKWKGIRFGEPFDYSTKKTQNQILKYFLDDRPIELVILLEGETEERITELILEARGVDLERDGFFVYNVRGLDNLQHLKPLFRIAQLIDITVFAMLDNDKGVDDKIRLMKESAKKLGYTKDIRIRKWNRDFESENFGIDIVLDKVNQILDEKSYTRINKKDVESRMKTSGQALITAIENTISKNNRDKLKNIKKGPNIISKPYLSELLIKNRLKEIQIADDPNWNAKLPIEKELKEVFKLIPYSL